jgi:transcriptional regulator with XRE-family HTH domain
MADDIDLRLGQRLRRRRRLLGLTQQQLAVAVGVRFQQIQKYECGANRISAARLWQLSQALETPAAYFFDGLAQADRPAEDSDGAVGAGGQNPLSLGHVRPAVRSAASRPPCRA